MILRLPPRIKVLEALGAIADTRVKIIHRDCGRVKALITSSQRDRVYNTCIDMNKRIAYSDDNGTKYRGYMGYPILSLLMIEGILPIDRALAEALKGIPWKQLNEYFRKYSLVEEYVKNYVKKRGVRPDQVDSYVSAVISALKHIKLAYSDECLK